MIRHDITPAQLRQSILKVAPNWFASAAVHVGKIAKLTMNPTSKHFVSMWSEIKEVWITLQGSKCIYCESVIEGKISNDIEHFRPKAKVSVWKVPTSLANNGITVTAGTTTKGDPGYRNLAYNPWNYAASCKVCNSVLKKNYFPISGKRNAVAKNPRKMTSEKALFVYPIGDCDTDPQTLIRFVGMHPVAAVASGAPGYDRALVMIEAFQLNNADDRKELFQSRARLLDGLYGRLKELDSATTQEAKKDAQDWIDIYVDRRAPHSSCMQSFRTIYKNDPARAARFICNAKHFLQTGSVITDDID